MHRRVTSLDLRSRGLVGTLSPYIGNLSFLRELRLSNNSLQGNIPHEIGRLFRLQDLRLMNNSLEGQIPASIFRCSNLVNLTLNNNKFVGKLTEELGFLSKLELLYIGFNNLAGGIPPSIGNLTSLVSLYAAYNKFSGSIPDVFHRLKNLENLHLTGNQLLGIVPPSIYNLSLLTILTFAENQLHGSLPPNFGLLFPNLTFLQIRNNNFTGPIPHSLSNASKLEMIEMGTNNFSGRVSVDFRGMKHLYRLSIHTNHLGTGGADDLKFVTSLLNCSKLKVMEINQNHFGGVMPNSIGEIPTKGVFTNATAVSLLGNKRLCGGISELKLSSCSAKEPIKRNKSSLGIILITIACILFGVTLVSSFVYFRFKRKRNDKSSESIQTLWKASYAMLLKATDSFSIANLIGIGSFGSVYKGIIDHDEQIVAIKVLNLQCRGASKSFTAECEALKNIRHRNLVKIITSCSSVDFQGYDFKALVYEYMPNGSLERWLRPIPESSTSQVQLQILSLPQRMNIVIDVAFALDYLHNQCQPPIIHCDLKPSNILLDNDMIAHVGDFGLAKFLQEFTTPNQSSSIGIRGTIGYAPPEYGLGSEVSTTGDVYSYGILLLELITGKKPIDSMFEEGLNLHKFSSMALPDRVMEIVDPILLNDLGEAEEVCLISMVKIGVACSMESHQDRMGMKDVLRELQLIKSTLEGTRRRQNMHRGP